jgi:hypothetical protein
MDAFRTSCGRLRHRCDLREPAAETIAIGPRFRRCGRRLCGVGGKKGGEPFISIVAVRADLNLQRRVLLRQPIEMARKRVASDRKDQPRSTEGSRKRLTIGAKCG